MLGACCVMDVRNGVRAGRGCLIAQRGCMEHSARSPSQLGGGRV